MKGPFGLIKKILFFVKTRGVRGIKNTIDNAYGNADITEYYSWITNNDEIKLIPEEKEKFKNQTIVNWIIPDIVKGSGGHTTILRFVSMLEKMGLHNRVYLFASSRFETDEEFRKFLTENFALDIPNSGIEAFCNTEKVQYANVTIATGWQTAYFVRRFNNTDKKYYFVQDFEPAFYPLGSKYIFAENTYKFGFEGITAGDWLKDKLNKEYGMKTQSFSFSYDKEVYAPKEKRDNKKRIFFYARPTTDRRAFELGLLALNEIHKKDSDIEIVFAGFDVSNYIIPFKHINAGLLTGSELADYYSQSDICIIMSLSNLSLLPLEIMACNSVVATGKGENNEWLVNNENAILFKNEPNDIAEKVLHYLNKPEELNRIRENGLKCAKETDWLKEASKIRDLII